MYDEQKLQFLIKVLIMYFAEHLKQPISYDFAFEQISLAVNGIRNERIHDGTCAFMEDFGNMNTFLNGDVHPQTIQSKPASELQTWQVND